MKNSKRNFIIFIILWLGVLDYLILTKSTINSPLLSSLSQPFYRLFTGNVAGATLGTSHVFSLIIINILVGILFYMSYARQYAKNKKLIEKKR